MCLTYSEVPFAAILDRELLSSKRGFRTHAHVVWLFVDARSGMGRRSGGGQYAHPITRRN